MTFTKRVEIEPSATMTINSLALQKRSLGEHVFNFAAGDPVVPNHAAILERVKQGLKNKLSPYPPVAGLADLRDAAASWMNVTYGTRYEKENTLVTCGGKFAIYAIAQALLEKGDEAVIIAPYWVSYPGIVSLAEAKTKTVQTNEKSGWKVTAEALEKAFTKKTKLLILNNGCNPTGALYTRQEIAEILAVCKEANVTVLSDEVYSEIVYEGKFVSCGSFPDHRDGVVVVQSCSKNFAMAGWRVGFVFGDPKLIKVLATIQGQSTTGTSIVSQWAALGALSQAKEVASNVREVMLQRRTLFLAAYEEHFGEALLKPASAIYVFAPISHFGAKGDSVAFCEKVLEKANVTLIPGIAFGTEGYVRFAFSGTEKDITGGIQALSDVC